VGFLQASPGAIWRQRIAGSLTCLLLFFGLGLFRVLPLALWHLIALGVFVLPYLIAWRSSSPRGTGQWLLTLSELGVLTVLLNITGGTSSPFQAIGYAWLFGSALAMLVDGSDAPVLPMCLMVGLSLVVGAWGSDQFVLYAVVHAIGLTAMSAGIVTLTAERRLNRADPLIPTILNRSAGIAQLEAWVQSNEAFTLNFVDLGDFKLINDRYGHRIGDEVLRAVASRLRGAVRSNDVVARYGGDEFIIATRRDESATLRLQTALDAPIRTTRGLVMVQADVGSVPFGHDEDLDDLLERADAAMYAAKRERKYEVRGRLTLG
jgi:diguanylate cyclase (GGDEF)-like protein